MDDSGFMRRAVALARANMQANRGGPFGAVIVRAGEIVAEGANEVTPANDPTAHAEIVAIRRACARLGTFQLTDCDIYASSEPCPMCLGAIYWARLRRICYASTRTEAAAAGFDDDFIYREIALPVAGRGIPASHLPMPEADAVFEDWIRKADKVAY
jgi:tRNA(Arg) A34 adenosine deaminase TadA